ncbi:hypothetical protein Syun_018013 [Stephania yunnanensis]|uniref:Uncharacterized protein n=1 Tax=Stephania yunnanensis TaxID=152371 RepID=A0AAP0IRK2_9MAGN
MDMVKKGHGSRITHLSSEEAGLYGWRGRAKVLEKRTQKPRIIGVRISYLLRVARHVSERAGYAQAGQMNEALEIFENMEERNRRRGGVIWLERSREGSREADAKTELNLVGSGAIFGYGLAWYNHFFVEGNVPTTFGHPIWSLMCDFKMFGLMLTGRMDGEIKRLGKRPVLRPFRTSCPPRFDGLSADSTYTCNSSNECLSVLHHFVLIF